MFQARYSRVTQEQFMHNLNLIQSYSVIFRTLAYLETKCSTHIQAYPAPSNMLLSNILCKAFFQTETKNVLFV